MQDWPATLLGRGETCAALCCDIHDADSAGSVVLFLRDYGNSKGTALVSFGGVSVKVAPGAGNAVEPLASCNSACQV